MFLILQNRFEQFKKTQTNCFAVINIRLDQVYTSTYQIIFNNNSDTNDQ